MAVHQEENATVEIAQTHPSDPDIRMIAVIRNIKALQAPEDIRQSPVPVEFDLLGSDNRNRSGCFRSFLSKQRSPINRFYLHLHQLLQVEAFQLLQSRPRWFLRAGWQNAGQCQDDRADWSTSCRQTAQD